ncbi:MAG TPA: tetratricopeptide repeat protein [Bacteroidia bacterium]|nr:tetratricopeptide repeat protein [Bacteroidia bacterium]HNS13286.1 tetratricopeptide repeat protein [Bacteroidia bacterium]
MDDALNTRIENLKKYLLDDPNDSFLRYALAIELFKNNELPESQRIFENLIIDNPEYLATYYQYGKFLEEIEDFAKATMVYETGIKIAEKQNNMRTVKELKEALRSVRDLEE